MKQRPIVFSAPMLRAVHPDKGGSTADMSELNQARDEALKECR